MKDIRVELLSNQCGRECINVLSQAYATNPIFKAVFSKRYSKRLTQTKQFFHFSMKHLNGMKYVAVDGRRILGVVHWVDSPGCFPPFWKRISLAPSLIASIGLSAPRAARWIFAWAGADPDKKHCHLGPIAVHPNYQGRGIGKMLMEHYCDYLDHAAIQGYLETDRPENISFYSRFGFSVIKELPVLGISTWLMIRALHNGKTL